MELRGARAAPARAGAAGRSPRRTGQGKSPGRAVHEGDRGEFRQRMGDEFGRYRRGAGGAVRQGGRLMSLQYRAAVLHAVQQPMSIETVSAKALEPNDVLVRVKA